MGRSVGWLLVGAICAAVVLPSAAAAATPAPTNQATANPTPHQIARAVARAEASSSLWATINICSASSSSTLIGVRGQIPALGFRSTLGMTIALDTWSKSAGRFTAINSPNAVNHVALGASTSGLQQAGAEFPFRAGTTGLWQATVTFTWTRAGRRLGSTTRTTTAGHPGADFSRPPHHSAATCRIS